MHQPGHRVLVVGAHRQHIAVGAHGDDRLLQGLGVGRRGQDLVQRVPCPGRGRAHLAPDIREVRRGAVGDLVLGRDGRQDPLFQEFVRPQRVEEAVDAARLLFPVGQPGGGRSAPAPRCPAARAYSGCRPGRRAPAPAGYPGSRKTRGCPAGSSAGRRRWSPAGGVGPPPGAPRAGGAGPLPCRARIRPRPPAGSAPPAARG